MDIKTPISKEQFEDICNEIETTEIGLLQCCIKNGISQQSFYNYMKIIGSEAKERYVRAKEEQIDNLVDQIAQIEADCMQAIETTEDPKKANALVNAYKLKCDNLKWIASKLKAKKYGDKIDITTDGQALVRNITLTPIPSKSNSDIQLNSLDKSDDE